LPPASLLPAVFAIALATAGGVWSAVLDRAPVAAAPAQTNGLTPDQLGKLAQLRAAGIDDATIAAAIGATVEQVTGVPF
uniref:hypothetical protein n=1 Tax=Microbacterium sp. SA075R TaxID=3121522 RepID=UPI003BA1FDF0